MLSTVEGQVLRIQGEIREVPQDVISENGAASDGSLASVPTGDVPANYRLFSREEFPTDWSICSGNRES